MMTHRKKPSRTRRAKAYLRRLAFHASTWDTYQPTPTLPPQQTLTRLKWEERHRIWLEAFYDHDFYPGEVVSRGYYYLHDVERGEVLKNPLRQGSFQPPYPRIHDMGGEHFT